MNYSLNIPPGTWSSAQKAILPQIDTQCLLPARLCSRMFLQGTDVQMSPGLVAQPEPPDRAAEFLKRKQAWQHLKKLEVYFSCQEKNNCLLISTPGQGHQAVRPQQGCLESVSLTSWRLAWPWPLRPGGGRRGDRHWLGLSWVPVRCRGRWVRVSAKMQTSGPQGHRSTVRPGRHGLGLSA